MGYYRDVIRVACAKKGISVSKLERDLNLSHGLISKQKENIKMSLLQQIADYLEISVNDLALDGEEQLASGFSKDFITKHADVFTGKISVTDALEKQQPLRTDYIIHAEGMEDILIEVKSLSPAMQQACLEKMAAMIQKFKELDNM